MVAKHGGTVLKVCRAILGPESAEDAWSETFLAALKAWPHLDTGTNLEAWLVTIAHNKAIDEIRRRGRRPVPAAELPESGGTDTPLDQDLWRAVGRLPARQRMCVAYHHLGGLPYSEVARLVGGSEDAARRAAADGIKALRKTYGGTA